MPAIMIIKLHAAYALWEAEWDYQLFLIAEQPHSKNNFHVQLFDLGSEVVNPRWRTQYYSIFKIFFTC